MKKIKWMLLLAAVMSVGLAACGDDDEPGKEDRGHDSKYVGFWYRTFTVSSGKERYRAYSLDSDGGATMADGYIGSKPDDTTSYLWDNLGINRTLTDDYRLYKFGAVSSSSLTISNDFYERITEAQWISLNKTGTLGSSVPDTPTGATDALSGTKWKGTIDDRIGKVQLEFIAGGIMKQYVPDWDETTTVKYSLSGSTLKIDGDCLLTNTGGHTFTYTKTSTTLTLKNDIRDTFTFTKM